jgi:predicted nucleotidyltransferase
MKRLPEKIRGTLEKIVKEMKGEENTYGVGLFGSWSRGDAVESSDIDLLVIQKGSFNTEFVERSEVNGILIDWDHIPKEWIPNRAPPRLDQKIYEMQILYDKDWSLTNKKLMMTKTYSSPERVEIRTKEHIVESDIYLSRATSAFSRKDFRSAQLFTTFSLESILRIPIEIALEPFSNSRFIQKLNCSTIKIGIHNFFNEYLKITSLEKADKETVEDKLKLFKTIWDEMNIGAMRNLEALESSHFETRTKLEYYLNPAFLRGMMMRTKSLIDSEKLMEATHYLKKVIVEIINNYIWLKSAVANKRIDYTTLIRSLETLDNKSENSGNILALLDLKKSERRTSKKTIEATRQIILKIRNERKPLIKKHLLKTSWKQGL